MLVRPDARRLAAWRTFVEAHAAVVALLERELAVERGLALSWYEVLLRLAEAPDERLRMQELARCLPLTKSGLTRLVDRMVAAGYIRREQCPSDRRGSFAVLTPQGRSALRRAAPVHLRGIQEHFARHLDDDQARVLTEVLTRIQVEAEAETERTASRG